MNLLEISSHSPGLRLADDLSIASHPFFADLDRAQIEDIVGHSRVLHFAQGDFLFREGEPANRLFLLFDGSVALNARVDGGHLVRILIAKSHEVIGWSWLFPPFAWRLQAQALEPTTALVCDGGHLLVMCEDDPVFGYKFMKRISRLVIDRLQATVKLLVTIAAILNPPAPLAVIR